MNFSGVSISNGTVRDCLSCMNEIKVILAILFIMEILQWPGGLIISANSVDTNVVMKFRYGRVSEGGDDLHGST